MLSLEEKVGQMMMVGFHGFRPPAHILNWLASGRIGGIYLFARNIESPAQVNQLIAECRKAAKYPILVGIDQEGGIVARMRDGFTESPGAMALGASGDPQLAEDVAYMMGREMAALGINWNFAPVADIAHHRDNPSVSTRSIGRNARLVSQMVAAQIRGFQRAGVAATVKHFPGLGNTIVDTHDSLAKVRGSLSYLYAEDLHPFRDAIAADVASVMLTHVMYEELDREFPATLSPRIVSGLLREELAYDGAVCTDCMEMKAIRAGFGADESAVLTVLAGVDMPLFSHTRKRQEAAYESVLEAARSGRISESRIDQSRARIHELKCRYPLDNPPPIEIVGSEPHQSLAFKAARAGTVLVNQGGALPLNTDSAQIAAIEFSSQKISDAVEIGSLSAFSTYLSRRLPNVACHLIDSGSKAARDSRKISSILRVADILILLTRNAHMNQAQLRLAQSICDGSSKVILVCARNPYDATALTGAVTVICTNGDSRPSLRAAIDAICGDFHPGGELTVELR